MFIQNYNLRKRLGMARLLDADDGAGSGSAEEGKEENSEENEEGSEEETKTFTQDEVDKLIKERIKREKKGQLSKEELAEYKKWKDSQKTESEKQSEALTNAEKAKSEAEERAL